MATQTDFSFYAGDDVAQAFVATDGAGNVVNLTGATAAAWTAERSPGDTPVITKTLVAGITVTGATQGQFTLALSAADTTPLSLAYYHSATFTVGGKTITVVAGRMSARPKPASTYSGDPSLSTRDYVRFLIGDTNMAAPLFTNPEIDVTLANVGGPLYAAAALCRSQAAKYSSRATKRVGDFSITYGDIARNFLTMAETYQAQADLGVGSGAVYCGGISKSDMASYRACENDDNVGAFTTLRAFDNRGAFGGFFPDNIGGE